MEDPRIARTRAAVIEAATDLLVDGGPSAVTVDGIVARSGVAKSTIYRHWQSRDDILLAVFEHCAPNPPEIIEGVAFEVALRNFVAGIVDTFRDPHWARVMPALLLLKTHEDGIAALENRLEDRQRDATEAMLQRGVDEGVLRPGIEVEEAMAHLVGPLMFAHLVGTVELDRAFGDRTVDVFLAAYGTSTARRPAPRR